MNPGAFNLLRDTARFCRTSREGKVEHYKYEVSKFVEALNLRYGFSDDCKFQLSFLGLLAILSTARYS